MTRIFPAARAVRRSSPLPGERWVVQAWVGVHMWVCVYVCLGLDADVCVSVWVCISVSVSVCVLLVVCTVSSGQDVWPKGTGRY